MGSRRQTWFSGSCTLQQKSKAASTGEGVDWVAPYQVPCRLVARRQLPHHTHSHALLPLRHVPKASSNSLRPHLSLGCIPKRKQHVVEFIPGQTAKEKRLVFRWIYGLQKAAPAGKRVVLRTRIMAGCKIVSTQGVGMLKKHVELHPVVAKDVGIRRCAKAVCFHKCAAAPKAPP